MTKIEQTLSALLDALKKEAEKGMPDPHSVAALANAIAFLYPHVDNPRL